MAWRPWEVRQATFADLMAAYEGWREAQGLGEPFAYSVEEVEEIRAEAFGED